MEFHLGRIPKPLALAGYFLVFPGSIFPNRTPKPVRGGVGRVRLPTRDELVLRLRRSTPHVPSFRPEELPGAPGLGEAKAAREVRWIKVVEAKLGGRGKWGGPHRKRKELEESFI